jgi:hypothetical protein
MPINPEIKFANNIPPKESEPLLEIDFDQLAPRMQSDFFQDKTVLESLSRLVVKLKERIYQYDAVISDEVSARLITLLIDKTFDLRGKHIPTYFVTGGHVEKYLLEDELLKYYQEVNNFFKRKIKSGQKVLLVTEYIKSGEGLNFLIESLQRNDIDLDIATLGLYYPETHYSNIPAKIIYGEVDDSGKGVGERLHDEEKHLAGVFKDSSDAYKNLAHPKTLVSAGIDTTPETKKQHYDSINQVRKDINLLAKELADAISMKALE